MRRLAISRFALAVIAPLIATPAMGNEIMESTAFDVIEFRRYTIRPGGRDAFAAYFDAYFPEAFQQLGAIAFGQFLERDNGAMFTWLRGFRDMEARKDVNTAFYYGPLWKEHRTTMNDLMIDSDNVLLLTPMKSRGVALLPAVDVVGEANGARGVVVAQIFSVTSGEIERFAEHAEETFARYRTAGAREAGVLVTLDAENNFPPLPVRTDGPHLVWLGLLEDNAALEAFEALAEQSHDALSKSGMLRDEPELIVMNPTRRSRLRWLAE